MRVRPLGDCGEDEKSSFEVDLGTVGRKRHERAGQVMVDAGIRPPSLADNFKHQITHNTMDVQHNVPGLAWSTFFATAVKSRESPGIAGAVGNGVRCSSHVGSLGHTRTLSTNVNVLACRNGGRTSLTGWLRLRRGSIHRVVDKPRYPFHRDAVGAKNTPGLGEGARDTFRDLFWLGRHQLPDLTGPLSGGLGLDAPPGIQGARWYRCQDCLTFHRAPLESQSGVDPVTECGRPTTTGPGSTP